LENKDKIEISTDLVASTEGLSPAHGKGLNGVSATLRAPVLIQMPLPPRFAWQTSFTRRLL
jgi:hypothetical protein